MRSFSEVVFQLAGIRLAICDPRKTKPIAVSDIEGYTKKAQSKLLAEFMIAVSNTIIENGVDLDVLRGGAWNQIIATYLVAHSIRRQDTKAVITWGFSKIEKVDV